MIKAIAVDDEPLALKVIQSHCEKTDFIDLQKTFTQPTEALKHMRKFPVDLIFSDIHMPSMTGISLVKALPQNAMIIFTTAFSNYAAESYELNAIEYLVKPISRKRFEQAADKAFEYYNYIQKQNHTEDKYIFVRADFQLVKISLTDIVYIEGLADYLRIYAKSPKPIIARMTMKEMLEKLPSADFIRVHRSYILPFSGIHSVRNHTIYLREAEKGIPVGRTYTQEFYSRYKP